MTKRKASVALDTNNESNHSSTQDNNSNSTSATNTTTGTSNNQGTTNGSTATGSGSVRQQNNNSNGQQKSKKERADNWSSAEIQVLHQGIESRRDIFHGPPSQATKKNRELAWDAITKEVNSVSTTPRSISQVMKKFKNEKCRAKRKFIDGDKDSHNNNMNHGRNDMNNTNSGGTPNNNANLNNQTLTNNSQQLQSQQQSHHMTSAETMSSQPSSINVVKLAPQNVAKTMIDLPSHVQQIQMPNDDMVLIVPPEMDGLLSGMNIVSDGGGHFQKCSATSSLANQHQNHHGQHTMQTINSGTSLVGGGMSNGMMARTIPAGSMSLVYSTGGEVCGSDQHLTNTLTSSNAISTGHISVNTQNLMHHRGSIEQSHNQHPHHHQIHQHQQHQHQQPHQQQQQQQQPPPLTHHPHQPHQPVPHPQHHLQQNHIATTATLTNTGGVAVESQLKNLLFNLLLKDGQSSISVMNANHQDHNKQRNDMLAIIANSLSKIEGHLSKISKVAGTFFAQNMTSISTDQGGASSQSTLNTSDNGLSMNSNDGNNNSLSIPGTDGTSIDNQNNSET